MIKFLPMISTAFIVISAIFVAFGWRAIIRRERDKHQKLMLIGAGFALAFFLIYVSRTLFVGNTDFGGPSSVELYYRIFLIFHIILSSSAAVFGLTTLYLAFKQRFAIHRKLGRITATVWFFTAITGVMVYVLLYLMYPGGETKPMIDAIFGL